MTRKKARASNKLSEVKGAAVAVVALVIGLIIGLIIGLFIPFGQVAPTSTITKTESILTTVIETQTGPSPVVERETITETETSRSTLVETELKKTTATITEAQTVTITTTAGVTVPPEKPIVILDKTGYTRRDYAYVEGIVQNQDTVRHEFVKVTIAWYDKDSKLVYTDYTYTNPSELEPGEKATFQVMTEIGQPVEYYEIVNISYQ